MSKQQKAEYTVKFNKEMDRITMSWTPALREWYKIAHEALRFANVRLLNIPQEKFIDLLKQEPQGLNMNVVMVLCNNLEDRSAIEMQVSIERWAEILLMNHQVAVDWNEMARPVQQKLLREYEILNNKPNLQIAQA